MYLYVMCSKMRDGPEFLKDEVLSGIYYQEKLLLFPVNCLYK